MESYYKYLPTSGQDNRWGLTVLNIGCGEILNKEIYPHQKHPAPYQFKWQQGRLLQEYQLIYISKGSGLFESETSGLLEVRAGTIILLFPAEWHRYRPNPENGWVEYWVGFKGNIVDSIISEMFFLKDKPLMDLGVRPDIISLYQDMMSQTRAEGPGYQPLVGGMVLHLLGLVHSIVRQHDLAREGGDHQHFVQKAMVLIRENIETKMTLEDIADELQIGYSLFRKRFKRYTGLAPGQYLIQLKIGRAKDYLLYTDMLVKEIAFDLNFESEYYFSKFFKEKVGLSPLAFKRKYAINCS